MTHMETGNRTKGGSPTTDIDLSLHPNALTRPCRTVIEPALFAAEGYQSYEMVRALIPHGNVYLSPRCDRLASKRDLVAPAIDDFHGSSLLDLGCNSGFFSLWAALEGYKVTAVDMDPHALTQLRMALQWLGADNHIAGTLAMEGVEAWEARVTSGWEPHGIVLALGIIHWLYDCTQRMGSLTAIVNYLAQQVAPGGMLLVEWVDATDPVIVEHRHLGENHSDWDEYEFGLRLLYHFEGYEILGDVSPTRRIYKAVKA